MELSAAWNTLSTALVPPAALGLVSGDRAGPHGSLRSAGPRAGPTRRPWDAPASAPPRPDLFGSGSAGRVGTARAEGGTAGAAGTGEERSGLREQRSGLREERPGGNGRSCRGWMEEGRGLLGVVSVGGCQGRATGPAALSPYHPNQERD